MIVKTIDDCVLPIDKPVYIGQGFNGHSTHHIVETQLGKIDESYAIDFIVDIGSKVYAARAGRIVRIVSKYDDVKDNYFPKTSEDVDEQKLQHAVDSMNLIIIEHNDGTYGFYAHLMKGGIAKNQTNKRKLRVGDSVTQGQLIGYSGNTGYSSQPHLHFCIYSKPWTKGFALQTIPYRFKDYSGSLEDKEIHPELHKKK